MKIKAILTTAYWLVIVVLLAIAGAVILTTFDTPLKVRLFSVQSASMRPTIPLGSLVVVQPQESYNKDDVITFRLEGDPKATVTHRIVEVAEDKDLNRISYQTKGDANEDPDRELIASRRVIGKVIFSVPYAGYPVAFAQTQTGLIVLVIIPATMIVYSEFLNIKKEVVRLWKERKAKSQADGKRATLRALKEEKALRKQKPTTRKPKKGTKR